MKLENLLGPVGAWALCWVRWARCLRVIYWPDFRLRWRAVIYGHRARLKRIRRVERKRREISEMLFETWRGEVYRARDRVHLLEVENGWLRENALVFDRDLQSYRKEISARDKRIAELEAKLKDVLGLEVSGAGLVENPELTP